MTSDDLNRIDVQALVGKAMIEWLNHADVQGAAQRKPYDTPPENPACWWDVGWRAAADIVRRSFADGGWVQVKVDGEDMPITTHRWRAFPDEFLAELIAKLTAERQRWLTLGGTGFGGAGQAVQCVINSIVSIRQEHTCKHEWSEVKSRGGYDEPPEYYRLCHKCRATCEDRDDEPSTASADVGGAPIHHSPEGV